jgi:adenylate kinase family enzyme
MAGPAIARRIIVLGCAGAGKTTFARRLGERIGAPHLCLDDLWGRELRPDELPAFRALMAQIHAGDSWISDGNFARASFDLRLPRAELVIWQERPRLACALRAVRRTLRAGEAHTVEKLPQALRFIWGFDRRNRPLIDGMIAELAPDLPVVRLTSDRETDAFIAAQERAVSA